MRRRTDGSDETRRGREEVRRGDGAERRDRSQASPHFQEVTRIRPNGRDDRWVSPRRKKTVRWGCGAVESAGSPVGPEERPTGDGPFALARYPRPIAPVSSTPARPSRSPPRAAPG